MKFTNCDLEFDNCIFCGAPYTFLEKVFQSDFMRAFECSKHKEHLNEHFWLWIHDNGSIFAANIVFNGSDYNEFVQINSHFKDNYTKFIISTNLQGYIVGDANLFGQFYILANRKMIEEKIKKYLIFV